MKARLSIVICVAALFLLSVSFAYAQQMDSSVFIPAAFVPVVPQMGAEIPDPIIHILPYGQNGSKRIFSVGEPLNIGVENATGAKIWYVRRRPPGMDSALLEKEALHIQRRVNNKWLESSDQYSTVIDDPDGQFTPVRHRIDPDVTVIRKWTPHEPGQYRVVFYYFTTPKGPGLKVAGSVAFRVDPK